MLGTTSRQAALLPEGRHLWFYPSYKPVLVVKYCVTKMLTLNNSDEVFELIKVEGSITPPQEWFQQMPVLIALSSDGHMTTWLTISLLTVSLCFLCTTCYFHCFPPCGALPLAFVCLVVLHRGIISQGFNGADVYGQQPFINVY